MTATPTPTPTSSHQALYRRWRAQTFAQIVGQEPVVETLRNAVRTDRVSHAILFVGPRGTGKTSLARILAKAVNCTNLQDGDPCDACPSCVAIREGRAFDLVEIDAASNRGIDAIRDLRERINYAPTDLRRKVYILDEAHQITKDAWNALLKSLEEPPDFVIFMFASTHPQDFPPAILSRLQRFDVRRLTVAEIEGKLTRILDADGRAAEPEAIRLIARLAAGGMRDAESMLDQLLASSGDKLDEARVRDLLGLAEADAIDAFVDALVTGDPIAGIRILDTLEDRGRDLHAFLDQVVESLRARLVASLSASGPASAAAVAAAARRLAAIDPNRAGTGGLRLQLELALFASDASESPARVDAVARSHPASAKATPAEPPAAPSRPVAASDAPERASMSPKPLPARPTAERAEAPPAPDKSASHATAAMADGPSSAPVGVAASPDLSRLVAQWSELVASVGPATRAVISECRPLSVESNIVTLGFPEAKAFLKDHAERKRPDLEAAIGRFLGRGVAVRCVATNVDLVGPETPDDDGAYVLNEARRIFAEDLVDVGEIN
ncbi:MAG TPA: DNA polymerase III subunit gamma/tau [Candidatus Limnocylindrales bacterium]|nr:DNA polymerase III subunit gamma/tau [Candidatus Limnocylindrales bacterium]